MGLRTIREANSWRQTMINALKTFLAKLSDAGCGCGATCRCGDACRCKAGRRCGADCTCAM